MRISRSWHLSAFDFFLPFRVGTVSFCGLAAFEVVEVENRGRGAVRNESVNIAIQMENAMEGAKDVLKLAGGKPVWPTVRQVRDWV